MTARSRTIALIVVGFAAFLLWSTLSNQRAECAVTVEFQGRSGSGTASGGSEAEAVREAQTMACGPITGGMNESIACANARPVSRRCRTL